MKKIVSLNVLFFILTQTYSQGILNRIGNAVKSDSSTGKAITEATNAITGVSSSGSKGLVEEDIIGGLKEALTVGTKNSAAKLGSTDGFFKDAAVKILMPKEAEDAATTLRKMGMGSMVDNAILSMNRAAEDAASGVGQIFIDAIMGMTIKDGINILNGSSTAATDFLKNSTTQELTKKMTPVIEASLKKVDATKYWKDVFTKYNMISHKKVDTDLTNYVTSKAMDGLFYSIAQEEQKIRKDPAARVSDLLKKVFNDN